MAASMRAYLADELLARRTGKAAVRAVVRDSRLSGFQCVIGARSKVFRLRLRLRLRRGCVTLWRWPMLSAEQVRTKALDLLRDLAAGRQLPMPTPGAVPLPKSLQPSACRGVRTICAAAS